MALRPMMTPPGREGYRYREQRKTAADICPLPSPQAPAHPACPTLALRTDRRAGAAESSPSRSPMIPPFDVALHAIHLGLDVVQTAASVTAQARGDGLRRCIRPLKLPVSPLIEQLDGPRSYISGQPGAAFLSLP
jgi:hypothetical protein